MRQILGTKAKESNRINQAESKAFTYYSRFRPLMERIGNARIVMLGEATHGTHEYYTWRSQITKRLIQEKDFNFIAVEGEWPDCYSLNRYIKQYVAGKKAIEVLGSFNRWPTWMWANWEIVALAEWLFQHNKHLPNNKKDRVLWA
jgi:erythromycin esterase-like protein